MTPKALQFGQSLRNRAERRIAEFPRAFETDFAAPLSMGFGIQRLGERGNLVNGHLSAVKSRFFS